MKSVKSDVPERNTIKSSVIRNKQEGQDSGHWWYLKVKIYLLKCKIKNRTRNIKISQ